MHRFLPFALLASWLLAAEPAALDIEAELAAARSEFNRCEYSASRDRCARLAAAVPTEDRAKECMRLAIKQLAREKREEEAHQYVKARRRDDVASAPPRDNEWKSPRIETSRRLEEEREAACRAGDKCRCPVDMK